MATQISLTTGSGTATIELSTGGRGPAGTTDYNALDNLPTLGSAAASDVGDFATAAQGATADTASQPGHTHVSADITDATAVNAANQIVKRGADGEAIFGNAVGGFSGTGVSSYSESGSGVYAYSDSGPGVDAYSSSGPGVYAYSDSGIGVDAYSSSGPGVYAYSNSGIGVYAYSDSGAHANFGYGKVIIENDGDLVLSAGYTEGVVSIGNSGTTQTLALTSGTFQTVTLTGNCVFTMPAATAGKSFVLKVLTGAGSYTGTFTGVKWAGGTAPTITATASRYDLISFIADGTAWSGSALQNFTP
jgi:hypothetical protein